MDLFYLFLIAGVVLLTLEIMTPGLFVFFSMGIAGLLVSIFTIMTKDFGILLIIFSILSIMVFFILKRFKIFKGNDVIKTNMDRYAGNKVKVISVSEDNKVRVKIFGEEWNGICEEKVEINEVLIVERIEGITMYLKKQNSGKN